MKDAVIMIRVNTKVKEDFFAIAKKKGYKSASQLLQRFMSEYIEKNYKLVNHPSLRTGSES